MTAHNRAGATLPPCQEEPAPATPDDRDPERLPADGPGPYRRSPHGTAVHRRRVVSDCPAGLAVPTHARTYRGVVGPKAMMSGFRDRAVVLLPLGNLRDWNLFTARANGAVSTANIDRVSLVDLVGVVEGVAVLFGMTTTLRPAGDPTGPIEFEVRAA